jgi:uncharacterized protein
MKWKRNTGFDQIEDRRGAPGTGDGGLGDVLSGGGGGIPIPIPGGAKGGLSGLVVILIIGFVLLSGILGGTNGDLSGLQPGGAVPGGTLKPQGNTDQQVAYIVDNIQSFWSETFSRSGKQYPVTKLVLFDSATQSGCGQASAATGPFYCPADQKVYLDLGFFDELQSRFGAKGGDFAMAYVIAYEFGHHVQDTVGVMEQVQQESAQDPSRQNDLSVRTELQADCLAGVWAHADASDLEPGDIDEALSAASAVGDDRIQQATQGRVTPESWTHGSADQRVQWFTTGYRSGNAADCDTFSA